MCGITGYWRLNGDPLETRDSLEDFTDSLRHRGPDGRGSIVLNEGTLYLGHRRLSILDLSESGSQPIRTRDGRFTLTFNGEIYNFIEIRKELESRGYQFFGESDSEVLLLAFDCWGKACVEHFNGMWAFAVWDDIEKSLHLCRDRFGVKPLYYWFDGTTLAFASEIKAFLSLKIFPLEFDLSLIARSVCGPDFVAGTCETIFNQVRQLPAGHWLKHRKSFHEPQLTRWWNTAYEASIESPVVSNDDAIERFLWLFRDACRLRMRSDVPLGTALSGGLDSSSVYAVLHQLGANEAPYQRRADQWQSAYIASYPGTAQDEVRYAKMVTDRYECCLNTVEMDPEDSIRYLEDYVFSMESVYPYRGSLWSLYGAMKKSGLQISVDGHGGDETLAGYHHHPLIAMLDASQQSRGLAPILNLRKIRESLYSDPAKYSEKNLRAQIERFLPKPRVEFEHGLLKVLPSEAVFTEFEKDLQYLGETSSNLKKTLYFDFHSTLLPTILRNFDRLSMAHGLEIRAPFLDYRLVRFSLALPDSLKLGKVYTKDILRSAMRGMLPSKVCNRKDKIGFLSPFHEWLKKGYAEMMLDRVYSQHFLESDIWHGRKIAEILHNSIQGNDWNRVNGLWPFIQADLLMELFENRKTSSQ